jgi:hypothetical protein
MPPLRALVSNMPPKHLDVDKVLYGFLVAIYRAWELICRSGTKFDATLRLCLRCHWWRDVASRMSFAGPP